MAASAKGRSAQGLQATRRMLRGKSASGTLVALEPVFDPKGCEQVRGRYAAIYCSSLFFGRLCGIVADAFGVGNKVGFGVRNDDMQKFTEVDPAVRAAIAT